MVSGESPAVARRRLRLALRKAREAKGLTQGQVADALDWSLSKVQRIESGDVTISSSDLKASLALFEVTDPKRVEQLLDVARASRRKGWWDEPKFRQHLTSAMMQLLQFEGEASTIRGYNPTLLPGLVQTRAYAEFILGYWHDELSEEDREVRLEVRMRRKEHIFGGPDRPKYLLVLDESVLHRAVGGPKVLAEQLQELLRLIQVANLDVRILRYTAGAHLAMLNPFMVLEFGEEENAVLYIEAQMADDVIHANERVRLYRNRFESLWEAAANEETTVGLIEERLADLPASP